MKFTPKHFLYVILIPPPHLVLTRLTKITFSQCFQTTLAKNLSDPPYTGGNYIDDCRFS